MHKFKIILPIIAVISLMSCSEKAVISDQITMLVTTNVRGQLDPCG